MQTLRVGDGSPATLRDPAVRGWRMAVGAASIAVLTVNMDSSADARRAPRTQMTNFWSGA